jgi:VWFA-related protein
MESASEKLQTFFEHMQPTDRVAIYRLADDLSVLSDFTSDGAALAGSLKRSANPETNQISGSNELYSLEPREYYKTLRGVDTPEALISLAHYLAGMPCRKNLIWLSGSFPISTGFLDNGTRRGFEDEIDRAARVLTDANIAVYPIDARGLRTADLHFRPTSDWIRDPRTYSTMDLLAERTGGKASYNNNDIAGAIRRAADDASSMYSLGYYPDQIKWDGTFHEINVKVNVHSAQVRFRRGYFAASPSVARDAMRRRKLLSAALSDPLDETAIGLRMEMISESAPAPRHLKMMLTIDPKDILLDLDSSRWTGAVDLYYAETDMQGNVLAKLARVVNLNLTSDAFADVMKNGVKVVCGFPLRPGAARIRMVALDSNSGRAGTVTITVSKLLPKTSAN